MTENHNIEDFFRKRLETHEFPFQEEDWLLLEGRLTEPGPSTAVAFLANPTAKTIVFAVAAITAAFILGWIARDLFRGNPPEQVIPDKPKQQSSVLYPEKPNSLDKEINRFERITKNVPGLNGNKEITNPVYAVTGNFSTGKLKSTPETSPEPGQKHGLNVAVYPDENIELHPASNENQDNKNKSTVLKPQVPLQKELPAYPPSDDISLVFTGSPEEEPLPAAQPKMPFRNRWMIGFQVAPDYNGIGFLHDKTVSTVFGGQLSYSITRRWSVSAGVLYNNKKYSGEAEYYQMPEGYWLRKTNGIIPDDISGSCRVIDIPIMATFHFLQMEVVSFTASAGIGSYLLLDEKYDYEFLQDNPGASTHWQSNENSSAVFSIANFAVGIAFQTSRKTEVTIEPYLKIPLKQIGWANVNLYSTGMLFTLKYRF